MKKELVPQLRAGNLLYFKGTEYIAKVKLINAPNHFDCTDVFGGFVPNGEYEPIPLTEDWLIRLGFSYSEGLRMHRINECFPTCEPDDYEDSVYHHVYFYHNGECFGFEVSNEWGENGSLMMSNIKYVHQLQNLYYALTNTELTLKE